MSSEDSSLERYLEDAHAQGEASDEGSFGLDPGRAAAILKSQGRLSGSGPLFLSAAVSRHAGPFQVSLDKGTWSWRISWPDDLGPLPETVDRMLADEAFSVAGISLQFDASGVDMRASGRTLTRAASILELEFQAHQQRLKYFPWQGSEIWTDLERTSLRMDTSEDQTKKCWILPNRSPRGTVDIVVHGLIYQQAWTLPVKAVIVDDTVKTDISLSAIPDSHGKEQLLAWAESVFLESLRQSLESAKPTVLDTSERLNPSTPPYVWYSGYLATDDAAAELREKVLDLVSFRDALGWTWTLRRLFDVYKKERKLLVVPERNEDLASVRARSELPVLLWTGAAKEIGQQLFANHGSGAGYLYSLEVNERERGASYGEKRWAQKKVHGGTLSLLSWSDPDRNGSVEIVGSLRARESFDLDTDAPKGMRLLWESDPNLEEALGKVPFDREFRQAVLKLMDMANSKLPSSLSQRVQAVRWCAAAGQVDWDELPLLSRAPLLFDVREKEWSYRELLELEVQAEGIPILSDRSTSLPRDLPVSALLWDHPLLGVLGLRTRECGKEVREAYWQQEGRDRWLARHEPREPVWPHESLAVRDGHRVARAHQAGQQWTEVTFWREGRPFGLRTLTPDRCPPGWRVLWVEDDLPGDTYWVGPDPQAIEERLPAIRELCEMGADALKDWA